jgi:hypothetical protein
MAKQANGISNKRVVFTKRGHESNKFSLDHVFTDASTCEFDEGLALSRHRFGVNGSTVLLVLARRSQLEQYLIFPAAATRLCWSK